MGTILNKNNALTMLEECFMFLEFAHRHLLKLWNVIASKSGYNIKIFTCRKIINNKLALVLKCRNHCPMHVSIDEYIKFLK